MIRIPLLTLSGALLIASASPAAAQNREISSEAVPAPNYGDIASHVLEAPLVIDATIRSTVEIRGAEAVNLAPGYARFYAEADVSALIRGSSAIPPRVGFVTDVPTDSRGRPPRLKRLRVILFARPVPGRPTMVQLTRTDSFRAWSPALDAMVRQIARDVVDPAAPPAITGVGNAFHVPGTLPGEGETQIFLMTETGAPVSLQILRRPGQQPRWAVSLGDIVDDSAGPPAPDTLLWYRLACGLPAELPASSLSSETAANAQTARMDYRFVLNQLGPCSQ
ncbi:hypothetical protein [Sphingosinithalassobacter portus]|uniref:hypothetical protein n=1 Tax=Stakelama portus TaxID=2676234 RepID=UPI0018737E61|nr:hypothetical protein [Sphingosinithalassobacter portus]